MANSESTTSESNRSTGTKKTAEAMFNAAEQNAKTAAAFDNPQVGDCFHEHLWFWVFVVGVTKTHVEIIEAVGPCELPKDGKYQRQTRAEFRRRFAYGGNTPAYWVTLEARGKNVAGWAEVKRPADTTSRETHLARLAELELELRNKAKLSAAFSDKMRYQRSCGRAESVRWAIEELSG